MLDILVRDKVVDQLTDRPAAIHGALLLAWLKTID